MNKKTIQLKNDEVMIIKCLLFSEKRQKQKELEQYQNKKLNDIEMINAMYIKADIEKINNIIKEL